MIPTQVKVAGIDYTVQEVEGFVEEHELGGQVIYHKGKIKIDSAMCKTKKEQIFVHELTHAIFMEAGYDEQDEDMVNRLSIVLYQVLKDNRLQFGKD
ncbi:ImmA/IrrE family metallo-endopeptidase [Sporosarcina sp. P17b]|uniref:ImmA/IrrE family metallo-endopeptidase n=1 Tax=Sporosarcina sp. P17b TaxID=2048260 RepID=UPI000C165DD2|nr:ImmA/IrrE family metallo-endopeptidase [Sporosarcina sp. P17b]PIC72419.1 ImmA/IrrE family metallo-endopeptidase [Sporosarcina sp. P17b]